MKSIVILHNMPLISAGLKDVLAGSVGTIITVSDIEAAVSYIHTSSVAVCLCGDVEAHVEELSQSVPVIAVVVRDSPSQAVRLIAAGASGVISMFTEREAIVSAVTGVMDGSGVVNPAEILKSLVSSRLESMNVAGKLSPDTLLAVAYLTTGMTNREIAEKLNITEAAIKRHLYIAMSITGASNRVKLALWALEKGVDFYAI